MRVDLGEHDGLEGLPRFQMAVQQVRRLGRLMYVSGGVGAFGLLLALSIDLFSPGSLWMAVLGNASAALILLAAGLQSARHVAMWRARALAAPVAADSPTTAQALDETAWYERLLTRLSDSGESLVRHIGSSTLWLAGWAVLALIVIRAFWNLTLSGSDLSTSGNLAGSILLLLAFGLLVIERQLSSEPEGQSPEAGALAQLVRMTLIVLLVGALCLFFSSADRVWPARLAVLIGLLPLGVALEFLLRAVLSVFSPRTPRLEPRLLAASFIADLLRWPPRPLLALQHELHNRFGIDLRQIWAFTYMRRAFLPVLAVVAALGWALSGVHEIPMQGRGIYERLDRKSVV